jgi:hypothetical protein
MPASRSGRTGDPRAAAFAPPIHVLARSQLVVPAGFTLTTVLDTMMSAGTLAMSGGTLAVQGNYTQTGGVLAYLVSPTSAFGSRVAVTGTANLGGVLAAAVSPGLYANSTLYPRILTANSINGQFAQVESSSVFLPATATYNQTSVDLNLNRIPFGAVPGLSANQSAVGNALESAYSTSLTGQQAAFFSNVIVSPTTNILTELSGEANTGAERAAFQLTNQFLTLMLDPFVNGRGYARLARRCRVGAWLCAGWGIAAGRRARLRCNPQGATAGDIQPALD